jgi:hypothetical protein
MDVSHTPLFTRRRVVAMGGGALTLAAMPAFAVSEAETETHGLSVFGDL